MKEKTKRFNLLVLPSLKNLNCVLEKFPFPVNLTKGSFSRLQFSFQGDRFSITHKGKDLKNFSFVWLSSSWANRDLAYAVGLYLKNFGVPFTYVEKSTSKLTDHTIFALNKIRTPDTLFFGGGNLKDHLVEIKNICGFPLVVKDIKGARGVSSICVNSEKELMEKMQDLPKHKSYLFQKYIFNKYDWGILVANGEVMASEKSYPCKGEFRNNVCNGAKEVFVKSKCVPEEIKRIALKTSRLLNLSWSRSDIIIDENTQIPYLMEINRWPGITPDTDEVTGAFNFLSSQVVNLSKE
ncbi:MAG: hypothetical protein R6V40_03745 [Candidatus Moraniibacteriota bacterium]